MATWHMGALLRRMLEHAAALGCGNAWVGTDHDNAAALALYRKLGGSGTDMMMFQFKHFPRSSGHWPSVSPAFP